MPKKGQKTDTNFKGNQALVVSYHSVKFQIDWLKRLQVRVWKQNFKMVAMAAILFFKEVPILKAT